MRHMPLMRRYRVEDSTVAVRHPLQAAFATSTFYPLTDYDMEREKVAMNTYMVQTIHEVFLASLIKENMVNGPEPLSKPS